MNNQGFTLVQLLVGVAISAATLLYLAGGISRFTGAVGRVQAKAEATRQLTELKRRLASDFVKVYVPAKGETELPVSEISATPYGAIAACPGVRITKRSKGGEPVQVSYTTRCEDSSVNFSTTAVPCALPGKRPVVRIEESAGGNVQAVEIANGFLCVEAQTSTGEIKALSIYSGMLFAAPNSPVQQQIDRYLVKRNVMENVEYQ